MRKISAVILAAMLCVGMLATNANAGSGIAPGGAIFDCTITLTAFPANVKTTNPTNCNGVATGAVVDVSNVRLGVANNAPWSATAQYTEPCLGGVAAGLVGFSNGRAVVNGIAEVVTGARTASLNTEYNWTRVGVVAIVTIGKLALLDNKKPPAQTTLAWNDGATAQDLVGGVAVAAFDASPSPAQLQCVPGPLTARVIGAFLSI
jgi:hypothetical protein